MEDPGIKLFGKKIVLPEISKSIDLPVISTATDVTGEEPTGAGDDKDGGSDHSHGLLKTCLDGESANKKAAEKDQLKAKHNETKAEGKSSPKALAESDNPKTPSIDEETRTEKTEGDATNPQPKTLKKPDKILPCPRCTSMDTKFCYYNNYNVNQPRHFCKSCQRYWTAGGAMRNMPVGAGRRKNKNPSSYCRYITISQEAFQAAAAALKVAATSDKGHRVSSGSAVTTSDSVPENFQDRNGYHSKVHCIPGVSWPYNPWNSTIPVPAICPPMPIYPPTYWNSTPFLPPSTPAQSQTFHPCDPILGKRSRDNILIKPNHCDEELKKPKSSVLIPKTLRIGDPDEAAKSSIWATLGIKNENFKAFQEKGEETKKHPATTTSPVLHANPAALSRSLCFQETA